MGKMEQRSSERTRRDTIRAAALGTLKLAGLLTVAVAAPNALQGLEKLGLLPGPRQEESMRRTYARLIKQGYVRFDGSRMRLTPKGEKEFQRLEYIGDIERQRGRGRWDKKWRVLTFDIPEKQRRIRNRIRSNLVNRGFIKLQDSVWIYPYNCEDFIALLKAELGVGYRMRYMIVQELEGDESLRRDFGLK